LPKKKTFSQVAYPDAILPQINDANHWSLKQSRQFIHLVWKGFDLLLKDFPDIDFSEVEEQIERDITQFLERRIKRAMTGDEPFDVQHEVDEMETRESAPAMPPRYDIAFILMENERLMFPFEAKVLKTDGQIGEYVKDINRNYLRCKYAPFSHAGGMIGYLLSGYASKVFQNLENPPNNIALKKHPYFKKRSLRYSEHNRIVPSGKEFVYPSVFRCDHLIFEISKFGRKAEIQMGPKQSG
jgi:hypothetical protein